MKRIILSIATPLAVSISSTSLMLASAAAAEPGDAPPTTELIEKAARGDTGAQLSLALA